MELDALRPVLSTRGIFTSIFDTSVGGEIRWIVEAAQLGPDALKELAARAWQYRSEVSTDREPRPKP